MNVPFYLVTGFLGSGKTTFLKHILSTYANSKKIAIIQNEFAEANVDGEELRQSNKSFEILEVNNGSVFCVCLLSNFIDSLSAFIDEHHPELIFLESSGLSDPISIIQLLEHEKLKNKIFLAYIWSIVDTGNILKLSSMMDRIRHQLQIADTIILNKTDVFQGNKQEIASYVRTINPHAQCIEATYCKVSPQLQDDNIIPQALKNRDVILAEKNFGRPDIDTAVLKTFNICKLEKLVQFLNTLAEKTIRFKGYIQTDDKKTIQIQASFQNIETTETTKYTGPTILIAIGKGINRKYLEEIYNKATQ